MHTAADQSSVVHSTFSIERTYPSPPARVFAAFANQATKRRWFAEGDGWQVDEFTLDFRVGGHEVSRFRPTGGAPMGNDTIYLDIVPDRRIVFVYTMTAGDKRISVSLATVEITPSGDSARLVYTEQGCSSTAPTPPRGAKAEVVRSWIGWAKSFRRHHFWERAERSR